MIDPISVALGLAAVGFSLRAKYHRRRLQAERVDYKHINELEIELGLDGVSNYSAQGVDSYAILAEAAAKVVTENDRVSNELEETLDPEAALKRHIAVAQATPGSILGDTGHKSAQEIADELERAVMQQHHTVPEAMRVMCRSVAEQIAEASQISLLSHSVHQEPGGPPLERRVYETIQPMDEPYPIEIITPSYSHALPKLTPKEKRERLEAILRP